VRSLALRAPTTIHQTILHGIICIMVEVVVKAVDVMDTDKAECSISRILPVRHPRYRDSNNCAFE
jgi:hypothetical protein